MAPLPRFEDECFFIAPIGDEGSDIRKRSDGVLNFIVAKACQELELTAVRADMIGKPGQITLQVVEHVFNAKAAVVDLTGSNPNVFYELAVRHAARKPVVLICERGERLPFDIGQMRTIFFATNDLADADMCRAAIVEQLREAIHGGAVDSPIATAVDITALQTGGQLERSVAELYGAVTASNSRQLEVMTLISELSSTMRRVLYEGAHDALPLELVDDLERQVSWIATFIESNTQDEDVLDTLHQLRRTVELMRDSPRMTDLRQSFIRRAQQRYEGDLAAPSLRDVKSFLDYLNRVTLYGDGKPANLQMDDPQPG